MRFFYVKIPSFIVKTVRKKAQECDLKSTFVRGFLIRKILLERKRRAYENRQKI